MPPSRHPCIDVSERESLGGLSHQHVEERINIKKGITKKTCHVAIAKGLNVNKDKRICKAC